MQRLLNQAVCDQDAVRDRLVRYVAAELGDPGVVLIADETGFLKSGRRSAGVQRQYTGTAGKITNCQVGVFLAYAVRAAGVRVLVDRELYVPQSWTSDRDRCEAAGPARYLPARLAALDRAAATSSPITRARSGPGRLCTGLRTCHPPLAKDHSGGGSSSTSTPAGK